MQFLNTIEKIPYTVLFILFALISYSTLSSDFLFIDDVSLIVQNPQLHFSWTNLEAIFTTPLGQIFEAAYYPLKKFVYYRPLLNLLYMFNVAVWGVNPVGFHITNLLLHLATTYVIYHIGLVLFARNRRVSMLAAALFCIYPVHNELIGRVAMNENLLGLLMAAALLFYLQQRQSLALTAFILALLTKESAIMLPFILMLFELRHKQLKATAHALIPYVLVVAFYLGIRTMVVGLPQSVGLGANWIASLLTVAASLASYLRLLLIPYPLKIYYPPFELVSPWQSELLLAVMFAVLIGCGYRRWHNEKLPILLLAGTIVLLAPVAFNANRLILGLDRAFIAERQLYVPSMLFVLFLGSLLVSLDDSHRDRVAFSIFLLLLLPLIYINIESTSSWQNRDQVRAVFFRDFPESELARKHRSDMLFKEGKLDAAMAELQATLPQEVQNESLTSERLHVKNAMKKFSGFGIMMERYGLAAYQPWYADVHFGLGQIYLAQNNIDAAMRKFKTALVLNPHFVDARTELAGIYLKQRLFSAASREYKLALQDIAVFGRP